MSGMLTLSSKESTPSECEIKAQELATLNVLRTNRDSHGKKTPLSGDTRWIIWLKSQPSICFPEDLR